MTPKKLKELKAEIVRLDAEIGYEAIMGSLEKALELNYKKSRLERKLGRG